MFGKKYHFSGLRGGMTLQRPENLVGRRILPPQFATPSPGSDPTRLIPSPPSWQERWRKNFAWQAQLINLLKVFQQKKGSRGSEANTTYQAAEMCPSPARKLSMLRCLVTLRKDVGGSRWVTHGRKPRHLAPGSKDSKPKRRSANAGNS